MVTKFLLTSLAVILFSLPMVAQTTIVLQPNSTQGKDAVIWSNDEDANFGGVESNTAYTWTNGGELGVKRSFIQFDFSTIPSNASIVRASLSLYYNPTDPYEGFDYHAGDNELIIERVLSSWDEDVITWNNQPQTSLENQVRLPRSTNGTQNYIDIDVTNMVIDMKDLINGNNGFIIKMADEVDYYRSVLFASSDHPSTTLHPKLVIEYVDYPIFCSLIKPNSIEGKDATVWSNSGDSNLGSTESNTAYTWTNGGELGVKRFFIQFDFATIPEDATVINTHLSLFYNPTDPYEGFDSHAGYNELIIERVSSSWDEDVITWNNQPQSSLENQVSLPPSTSGTQNYMHIDVGELVVDMRDPANGNNGFIIKMADEVNYYKSVLFASSDHSSSALHPEMKVCWIIENCVWNGSISSEWNNPENWENSLMPSEKSIVSIPLTINKPVINHVLSVKKINVESGTNITIAAGGLLQVLGDGQD